MESIQKVSTKKKKSRFYETYISKIIRHISEKNGVTSNAKQQLNSVLCHISRIIAQTIINLTEIAKKKTISEKEVNNGLKIILPKHMADQAIQESHQAISTYTNIDNKNKGSSRQDKAGIIFPPAQTEKFLRNFGYSKIMITNKTPICLAGAMQYITSEILQQASDYANKNKRVRITIRDLEIGVRTHEYLNIFFNKYNITFIGGGVTPYIHPSLLIKKKRKKTTKQQNTTDNTKKKHRFRPGTVSLREIRRFQKISNCLTFAKYPFEKLVRNIVNQLHRDNVMKISKDVFIILQYFIEQRIVHILRNANFAAIHANRVKLLPIDIKFVQFISSNTKNPYFSSTDNDITQENDLQENEDNLDCKDDENNDTKNVEDATKNVEGEEDDEGDENENENEGEDDENEGEDDEDDDEDEDDDGEDDDEDEDDGQ